jgi:hypothetical protein
MENEFTPLIQSFVKRRNLPVEQLANMANISRKTLYRWVNGEVGRPRHWSQIVAVSAALRLTEMEANHLLATARFPDLEELMTLARFQHETDLLEAFSNTRPLPIEPQGLPAAPNPSYAAWTAMEAPAGAVQPDSPFYIRRSADDLLAGQVLGTGTTTTIQAGRQTGKTSLLMQGIRLAREAGTRCVYVDFQLLDDEARSSLDGLLDFMADVIVEQLDLDPETLDPPRAANRSAGQSFSRFLQRAALTPFDEPLLLAVDEADLLLDADYKKHFFALLRAWDSRRAFDPDWRRLNLVMVISTHPYLLIDDIHLSPFNVGLTISLEDFTRDQVDELNRRHGSLLTPREIPILSDLVGGHPYLTRQAFYTMVTEKITVQKLAAGAHHPDGPFSKHLRFYNHSLSQSPELREALVQLLKDRSLPEESLLERLAAVGLVGRTSSGWKARCSLYDRYFREAAG